VAEAGAAGGLIGTLFVRLTAQTAELDKNMAESEKKVVHSAEHMSHAAEGLKHALELLGLAFTAHEIVEFVKGAVEGADEMKKFSTEVGISIEKLAGFKFAADKANVGENFHQGMRKFAEAMREAQVEGSNMQSLFRDVLQIDPGQGMDKAFEQAVSRFSKWEDGVNKMGVAQELFGTRNARFVNLLSQGNDSIRKDSEELARFTGSSYEEAAKRAEEYNDAVTTLRAAFTGLALAFANELLPTITELNLEIAKNVPLGREMAKVFGTALVMAIHVLIETIKGLLGAFKLAAIGIIGLAEGWMKTMRWLAEGISTVVTGVVNGLLAGVNLGIKAMNSLLDMMPDWLRSGTMTTGHVKEISWKMDVPETKGLDNWIDTIHEARQELSNQLAEDFKETAAVIKEGNENVDEAIKGKGGMMGPPAPNMEAFKDHQERMRKFMEDSKKGSSGLRMDIAGLGGIEGLSEATRMQEEEKQIGIKLANIQKLRDDHFDITEEQEKRMSEMEALYAEKRKAIHMAEVRLKLTTASTMFGDLADITAAFAGKQSGIYKAMFATSKAFAIAEATVKIALGIAEAAGTPWPMNLFAMASVVAATASIVSSIQAVQLEFGGEKALGGPVVPGKAFLVGERGPELFSPASRGSITPNDALRGMGGNTQVVIHNYTDSQAQATERQEGDQKMIRVVIGRVKNELAGEVLEGHGPLTHAIESTFKVQRGGR
jgi:hypothetical protein